MVFRATVWTHRTSWSEVCLPTHLKRIGIICSLVACTGFYTDTCLMCEKTVLFQIRVRAGWLSVWISLRKLNPKWYFDLVWKRDYWVIWQSACFSKMNFCFSYFSYFNSKSVWDLSFTCSMVEWFTKVVNLSLSSGFYSLLRTACNRCTFSKADLHYFPMFSNVLNGTVNDAEQVHDNHQNVGYQVFGAQVFPAVDS